VARLHGPFARRYSAADVKALMVLDRLHKSALRAWHQEEQKGCQARKSAALRLISLLECAREQASWATALAGGRNFPIDIVFLIK
jgi:hypothetical protein